MKGAAALDRIYAKIGGYKRTHAQQHWKDKVRQTLQYHPNIFSSPERGVRTLNKYAA